MSDKRQLTLQCLADRGSYLRSGLAGRRHLADERHRQSSGGTDRVLAVYRRPVAERAFDGLPFGDADVELVLRAEAVLVGCGHLREGERQCEASGHQAGRRQATGSPCRCEGIRRYLFSTERFRSALAPSPDELAVGIAGSQATSGHGRQAPVSRSRATSRRQARS